MLSMGASSSFTVLLVLFALLDGLMVSCCAMVDGRSNASCLESELKVLVKIRQSLIDNSGRLSSWVGNDCCSWEGVGCIGGHVVKLDLGNPIAFDPDRYDTDYEYYTNYTGARLQGEINPSILSLKQLHYLDLSRNDFSDTEIPDFLGSATSLRCLQLSDVGFVGSVPHHLGNLSNLQYLDLSNHGITSSLTTDDLWWASRLSSLKYLDLTGMNLEDVPEWLDAINMIPSILVLNMGHCQLPSIPSLPVVNFTSLTSLDLQHNGIYAAIPLWIANISSLTYLNLEHNGFRQPIPETLGRLTSLTFLDLSYNSFNTSFPNTLCKLHSLVHMDLSDNKFSGSVPLEIGNLTQLVDFHLSRNSFEGKIPDTIANLCLLQTLQLSYNDFSGEVSGFLGNPTGCLQKSLRELYLTSNQFTGVLPKQLGDFKNLEHVLLALNSISGPVPESIGMLSGLKEFDINSNQLKGSIPSAIGQLLYLEKLDFSNNSLSGIVSEDHLSKLTRLTELSLSLNSLVLNVSSQWVPPFQLIHIYMKSCKLGPRFPAWLKTQKHVQDLVISNASISDIIPEWFENVFSRLDYLDMSLNKIRGKLPKFQLSKDFLWAPLDRYLLLNSNEFEGPLVSFPTDVTVLDLSNNFLSGQIPTVEKNLTLGLEVLVLSNNRLAGSIPVYLCNVNTLAVIDLSGNQFSGGLPSCLGDIQELEVLDFTDNVLNGTIPSSLGSLEYLQSLHLRKNRFEGKLPSSLQNLTNLITLDLGNNNFIDVVPSWIGEKLYKLKILSLQSNKFFGDIPLQFCNLPALHLINLASNNISGSIPPCISNFTAMLVDNRAQEYVVISFYEENIIASAKGRELRYTKTIPFLISIDLSSNNIVGTIPSGLMNLFGLRDLNLAGNNLNGIIPQNIGYLKQLESLDLSKNKLSGPIPQSLSLLNYLSHLNLSYNNLSGIIPTGNQLQTLTDPSIYMGNAELCGLPLLKSCPGSHNSSGLDHVHVGKNGGKYDSEHFWFYTSMGPGFFVGFLGFCGILHFNQSWRHTFFQLFDNAYDWLVVAIAVNLAWLKRKFPKANAD